jgi:DNA-directed RNA polymerase specialized sigma subunit
MNLSQAQISRIQIKIKKKIKEYINGWAWYLRL